MSTVLLRLLRAVPPCNAGEIVGYDDRTAARLIRIGAAVKVEEPEPVSPIITAPVVVAVAAPPATRPERKIKKADQ